MVCLTGSGVGERLQCLLKIGSRSQLMLDKPTLQLTTSTLYFGYTSTFSTHNWTAEQTHKGLNYVFKALVIVVFQIQIKEKETFLSWYKGIGLL